MKKAKALAAIGVIFTERWIPLQEDKAELKGFKKSADGCRYAVMTDAVMKVAATVTTLLCIYGTYLEYKTHGRLDLLPPLFLVICVGWIVCACYFAPGRTSRRISRDWSPIRKRLVRLRITKRFKEGQDMPTDLRDAFVTELTSLADKVRESEREGYDRKKKRLKKRMDDVLLLASEFGISLTAGRIFREKRATFDLGEAHV